MPTAYITQDDLTARFGSGEVTSLAVVTSIAQCIEDACTLADGYVAKAYTLPLSSIPPIMVGPLCDIARFYAYTNNPPDNVRARYTDALKFLNRVGSQDLLLNIAVTAPDQVPLEQFTADSRMFTRRKLAYFFATNGPCDNDEDHC